MLPKGNHFTTLISAGGDDRRSQAGIQRIKHAQYSYAPQELERYLCNSMRTLPLVCLFYKNPNTANSTRNFCRLTSIASECILHQSSISRELEPIKTGLLQECDIFRAVLRTSFPLATNNLFCDAVFHPLVAFIEDGFECVRRNTVPKRVDRRPLWRNTRDMGSHAGDTRGDAEFRVFSWTWPFNKEDADAAVPFFEKDNWYRTKTWWEAPHCERIKYGSILAF